MYPLTKEKCLRVTLKLVDSKEAAGLNCFLLTTVNWGYPVHSYSTYYMGSTCGSALMRKGNQASIGIPIPGPGVELIDNDALTIQVAASFIKPTIRNFNGCPFGSPDKNEKKLEILRKFRNSIPGDVTVKAATKDFKAHGDFLKGTHSAPVILQLVG